MIDKLDLKHICQPHTNGFFLSDGRDIYFANMSMQTYKIKMDESMDVRDLKCIGSSVLIITES